MGTCDHPDHPALARRLQACLRWRNAQGSLPDMLAAQRRERARIRSERQSDSELRVLRYLPTNLTAPEIAAEPYVSHHTVKTHVRNLYMKLGTHRRAEAVEFARDLGLLAPSAHSPG